MLDKCANPGCPATFRSLRDGRVFVTEIEADYQNGGNGHGRRRQYFWLCNSCGRTMTVIVEKRNRGQVLSRPASATAARAG